MLVSCIVDTPKSALYACVTGKAQFKSLELCMPLIIIKQCLKVYMPEWQNPSYQFDFLNINLVYKECPSVGYDMTEIMVLQHYPLQQGDIMSDLNIHILNTFNSMHGVWLRRVSIKIAGIGFDGYQTVLRRLYNVECNQPIPVGLYDFLKHCFVST
jgi:hypothetical protein